MMRLITCLLVLLYSSFNQAQAGGKLMVYTNRADLVEQGAFQRWTKEFRRSNPAARIEVTALERYDQEISARISRGDSGDVLLIPSSMPKAAWPSYFAPLNNLLAADEIYFPSRWQYAGKRYGLSQGVSVEGLIYHKKLFTQHQLQVPRKLSEFFALCESLKKAGIAPMALNIGAGWPLQQWDKATILLARDGDIFRQVAEDSAPFSKGKPYRQSIAIAQQIYSRNFRENEIVRDGWNRSLLEFHEQNIAMFFMGSWLIPQLMALGVKDEDIGFVPFPVDERPRQSALLNVEWALGLNKKSKNPKLAKAWIKFLLYESDYADVSGFLPGIKNRKSGMPQLLELLQSEPELLQAREYNNEFLRLANKAGIDFLEGGYIRNILLNPDFSFSMKYWNAQWKMALAKGPAQMGNPRD